MTDMQNDNKKSRERFHNNICSIHPVENGCSSANVLRPNFGGPMKHADTNTTFTRARDARKTVNLRNITGDLSKNDGVQPERETDPGSQEAVDLEQEERSDENV